MWLRRKFHGITLSPSANYFSLFGFPLQFSVDHAELQRCFRELQKTVHPDRYAHAGDAERLMAVREAARINDAYQTLKDPVRRARYLLEIKGEDWRDEQTLRDPAFLMDQMELREALEDAVASAQLDELEHFCTRVKKLERNHEASLADLFKDLDHLDLAGAKKSIQKLMFFRKLSDEAETALSAAFDAA